MKNSIFFLLGVLISFLLFVPFSNAATCGTDEPNGYPETIHNPAYKDGYVLSVLKNENFTGLCEYDGLETWSTSSISSVPGPAGSNYYWVVSKINGTTGTCYMNRRVWQKSGTCEALPAEPSTCFNSIQDEGEEGVNCGGECNAPCEEVCPPNTELLNGFEGEPGCFWYGLTDSAGNCPVGSESSADQGVDGCYKEYDTVLAAAGTELDEVSTPAFSTKSLSIVESSTTSTVDNGDGTSTKTTVTQKTGSDGSSSTTTQSDVTDNETGAVLSSTITEDIEEPPEDNPENYDLQPPGVVELPDTDFLDLPEEKDLDSLYDGISSWNPFSTMNEDLKIETSNPSCEFACSISIPLLREYDLNFGLCDYEWVFSAIGLILNFCAVSFSFYIVARGR